MGEDSEGYGKTIQGIAHALGVSDSVVVRSGYPFVSQAPYYAAADVFVSPSDTIVENFGLTPVEAMACGIPVVVSDWDGCKDTVVHGETGFRVPTYWALCDGIARRIGVAGHWREPHLYTAQSTAVDVDALTEALLTLLRNPSLREQMGAKGRQRAVELYDWRVVVKQYEALWQELKAEALADTTPYPDRTAHLHPAYFRNFGHYASRLLDEETKLSLGDRQQLPRKGQALPLRASVLAAGAGAPTR